MSIAEGLSPISSALQSTIQSSKCSQGPKGRHLASPKSQAQGSSIILKAPSTVWKTLERSSKCQATCGPETRPATYAPSRYGAAALHGSAERPLFRPQHIYYPSTIAPHLSSKPLHLPGTPRPLTDRQYQNLKPGPFRTCHLVLHVSGCSDQIYICVNCLLRCDRAIKRAHPGFWTDTPRGFQLRTRPCCTPSPSIGKSSSRMLLHPCKSSSRRMVSAHSEPGGLPLTSGNGLQE